MSVGRLQHTDCRTYHGCLACRRNDDAFGMMAGTFGCLVIFTVCPVTVLFVMAAHGIAGTPGTWAAIAFLATLPAVVGVISWIRDDRKDY